MRKLSNQGLAPIPLIELETLPTTWTEAAVYYGIAYFADWFSAGRLLANAVGEFCSDELHPETKTWGQPNSLSLKFVDPAHIADWCDNLTSQTAVNNDRCVIVRYDVPEVNCLDEWRR